MHEMVARGRKEASDVSMNVMDERFLSRFVAAAAVSSEVYSLTTGLTGRKKGVVIRVTVVVIRVIVGPMFKSLTWHPVLVS